MTNRLIDDDLRQAALDPKVSFVVRAPAGSGKTHLLLKRLFNVLLTVDQPEKCLILTFTNKAVEELRSRLYQSLAGLTTDSKNAELNQLRDRSLALNWQLEQQPQRIKIMTIDSYFFYLFKKFSVSHFQMRVQSAKNPDLIAISIIEKFIADFFFQKADPDLVQLAFSYDNNIGQIKNLLTFLYQRREIWLSHFFSGSFEMVDYELLMEKELEYLNNILDDYQDQLNNLFDFLLQYTSKSFRKFEYPLNLLQAKILGHILLTQKKQWRKTFRSAEGIPAKNSLHPWHTEEDREQIIQGIQSLQDYLAQQPMVVEIFSLISIAPQAHKINSSHYQTLIHVIKKLLAFAQVEKQMTGEFDYSDVVLGLKEAIFDEDRSSFFEASLECELDHLFIDEVQDLSMSQWEIFKKIISTFQFQQKSFFFVGDPQQAIYHFRGAQIGVFNQLEDFTLHGIAKQNICLRTNFRSAYNLVEFVNEWGECIFGSISFPLLGVDHALRSHAYDKQSGEIVCRMFSDEQQEAMQIGLLLKDWMNDHPGLSVGVLARDRQSLQKIIQVFKKLRIDVHAKGLKKIIDAPIILNTYTLIFLLVYPGDKRIWLQALKSSFLRTTYDDIFNFYQYQTEFWDDLDHSLYSSDFLHDFNKIKELYKHFEPFSKRCPLHFFVKSFFRALHLEDFQTQEDLDDWHHFFDLFHDYTWQNLPDLVLIQKNLDKQYNQQAQKNQITVTTIHQSKGLEFDLVVLPSLGNKLPSSDAALMYTISSSCAAYWTAKPMHQEEDEGYNFLKKINALHQEYESSRLLYVALTRAKKTLWLSWSQSRLDKRSFYSLLQAHIDDPNLEYDLELFGKDRALKEYYPQSLYPEMTTPQQWRFNTAAIQSLEQNFKQTQAKVLGLVLHELLFFTNTFPISKELLSRQHLCSLWLKHGGCHESFKHSVNKIGQSIISLYQSEHAKTIFDEHHLTVLKEWSLQTYERHKLKSYTIDRLYCDRDGIWTLIEFKSSPYSATDELTQIQYKNQVLNYLHLLQKMGYQSPRGALYYIADDTYVTVTP